MYLLIYTLRITYINITILYIIKNRFYSLNPKNIFVFQSTKLRKIKEEKIVDG